jgi:hypothetical protein
VGVVISPGEHVLPKKGGGEGKKQRQNQKTGYELGLCAPGGKTSNHLTFENKASYAGEAKPSAGREKAGVSLVFNRRFANTLDCWAPLLLHQSVSCPGGF